MIKSYSKPQLLVRQDLDIIPDPEERSLNAFTPGPQFDLFRYTNEDEKAAMSGVAFVENSSSDPAARQVVTYEGLQFYHQVDAAFARLYGKNLEGQYLNMTSSTSPSDTDLFDFNITDLTHPNRIKVTRRQAVITGVYGSNGGQGSIVSATIVFAGSGYAPSSEILQEVVGGAGTGAVVKMTTGTGGTVTSVSVVAPGFGYTESVTFSATAENSGANVGHIPDTEDTTPLLTELRGRPFKAGDIVYSTFGDTTTRRIVREVIRETAASTFGSNTDKNNKQFGAALSNPSRTNTALFTNTSAPAGWSVLLAAYSVIDIPLANAGSGFTSAPSVNISAPYEITSGGLIWPAVQATADAILSDAGTVEDIEVTNSGSGYYRYALCHVNVLSGGTGYSTSNPPTITVDDIGGDSNTPQLEAVITGDKITGVKITNPGYNYHTSVGNVDASMLWNPASNAGSRLSIAGGSGSGAMLIGLSNGTGAVRSCTITNAGSGYTEDPTYSVSPHGSAEELRLSFRYGAGSLTITNAGTGYEEDDLLYYPNFGDMGDWDASSYSPVIIVTAVNAITGAIEAAEIQDAGRFSGSSEVMCNVDGTYRSGVEGGSGNGDAILTFKNKLVDIIVTDPGAGYNQGSTITFTGGAAGVDPVVTPMTATINTIASLPAVTITGGGGSSATATLDVISSASDWNGLVEGSIYDGKYSERYTITVTQGGSGVSDAKVSVRSASGAFTADAVTAYHYGRDYLVSGAALGGLSLHLRPPTASTALRLGDTFTGVVIGKYAPLELSASGFVTGINVISAGSGYTDGTHALVISAPPAGGTQAEALVTVRGNTIYATIVTNIGSGYTFSPSITMPTEAGAGSNAIMSALISLPEASRDLVLNQNYGYTGPRSTQYQVRVLRGVNNGQAADSFTGALVRVSDTAGIDVASEIEVEHGREYNLGSYGLRFQFPADLSSPSGVALPDTAMLSPVVVDGVVIAVSITSGGSGYVYPPSVAITGTGSNAAAVAYIQGGRVVAVEVTDGGTGYGDQGAHTYVNAGAPSAYQSGLRTGDTYYVEAVAGAENGTYSTIVLNGQSVDITGWSEADVATNKLDVDARVLYNGIITQKRDDAPNIAWEAGTNAQGGILVRKNLMLELTDRDEDYTWVPVKESAYARLFAHWRGLVPAVSSDKIKLFTNEQAITEAFGKYDIDNPVCYSSIIAFRAGLNKPVYVARLASNDEAGHTALIRQAEHIDGIFTIVVTSEDEDIKALWAAHVQKMSLENWKLWRRVYFGIQNPGPYASIDVKDDGTDYTATVTTTSNGNVRVVCPDGDFLTLGVQAGDLFRTNYSYDDWQEAQYEEYVVYTVTAEDELILRSGPTSPISPAQKFEIWKDDSGLSQALFVGERAEDRMNRRVCHIWCDEPQVFEEDGSIKISPTYPLAAEAAGLRAALLPQQGLTHTEFTYSLDACPLMFTKYSEDELNAAASRGVWIIVQDWEDSPIYVRHQLTTQTNAGILYYEDSVGANLDTISYAVKDLLEPYIGKRNVNAETLEEIETKMRDLLNTYKKTPGGFSSIGPALIEWRDLSVRINATFKDRIDIDVTLELPLPINKIVATLHGTTASDETVATINAAVNAPDVAQ
jgi:hypothetical protein